MSTSKNQNLSWLLDLPKPLEERFYQDGSVHRTFTMFDLLAITQAFLVNVRLLQVFGRPSDPDHEVMLLRDRVMALIYITLALFQVAFMRLRPQQYSTHSRWIALCNRLLRLLAAGLGALFLTPAEAKRQGRSWLGPSVPGNCAEHEPSGGAGAVLVAPALRRLARPHPSTHGINGCPAIVSTDDINTHALIRTLLLLPAVYLLPANFVLSFRLALLMQLGTFFALACMDTRRVCVLLTYDPVAAASAVPACQALSWLAHAGSRLLDVLDLQLLAGDADSSTDGLPLCREPLRAILLMNFWINFVVVVLLPCTVIYSLERSLKLRFLSNLAAAASAAPPSAAEEGPGAITAALDGAQLQDVRNRGQQEPHQQQPPHLGRRQPQMHLQQQEQQEQSSTQGLAEAARANPAQQLWFVLDSTPPLSVYDLPPTVLCVLQVAAAMLAVVGCWYACEAVLSLVLRGGHFVCDADGWLGLAAR